MYQANCFNVMIVSPSDVEAERKIIKENLYRWNELNSRFRNMVFSVLGYDINACPDSGSHPQEILNHQLLEQADLIIAVFWTKLGSPTTEYSSGSVEEITRHIAAGKKALIYFSNKSIEPQKFNAEQYSKLQEYKSSIKGNVFYYDFSSEEEFNQLLQNHIQTFSNEILGNSQIELKDSRERELSFTETEIQVLKVMKERNQLQFIKMLGGTTFGGYLIQDARQLAELEEAIDSLEMKGYIKATSYKRNLFDLTASGFRACDQISE